MEGQGSKLEEKQESTSEDSSSDLEDKDQISDDDYAKQDSEEEDKLSEGEHSIDSSVEPPPLQSESLYPIKGEEFYRAQQMPVALPRRMLRIKQKKKKKKRKKVKIISTIKTLPPIQEEVVEPITGSLVDPDSLSKSEKKDPSPEPKENPTIEESDVLGRLSLKQDENPEVGNAADSTPSTSKQALGKLERENETTEIPSTSTGSSDAAPPIEGTSEETSEAPIQETVFNEQIKKDLPCDFDKIMELNVGTTESSDTELIEIPTRLMDWHRCDSNLVLQRNRLPSRTTVEDILFQYRAARKESKPEHVLQTFVNSMTAKFNYCLHFVLLFRRERIQFLQAAILHPDLFSSQLYGASHLLRLITLLQGTYTNRIFRETSEDLGDELEDFVSYLNDNFAEFFREDRFEIPDFEEEEKEGKE